MTTPVIEVGEGYRLTGSDSNLADKRLLGFLCDASSTGTLTVADRAGSRTLISAMPLVAGQFYALRVRCAGQINITIGGTASGLLTYAD